MSSKLNGLRLRWQLYSVAMNKTALAALGGLASRVRHQTAIGRLRELRRAMGLSADALARRLGVHPVTVRRWESGTHTPSFEELDRLFVLYAKRLARQLTRRAVVARRHLDLDVGLEFRKAYAEDVVGRVQVLAAVVVWGDAAAANAAGWRRALGLTASFFETIPPMQRDGEPLYPALRVGIAMEAALYGRTYAQQRDEIKALGIDYVALAGLDRVMTEVKAALLQLEAGDLLPLTDDELDELRGELRAESQPAEVPASPAEPAMAQAG